jgi:DNA-binding CsgD family transcriptional regulator
MEAIVGHPNHVKSGPAANRLTISARSASPARGDETLICLVGHICDAALDSALWPDVLAKIADFVGGEASALCSKRSESKFVNANYHAGLDSERMQAHSETYGEFDPLATLPLFDVGQVVSIPELVPYDEYCRGRFYQEWARPQGWGDVASAVIEKSGQGCTFLNVVRSEASGMVDGEMRRRMALVTPHARRAVLIGEAIDLKAKEAATFADVLDGLSAGLFLIDANGRIVHANAAGRGILDADDFMRSIGGRLVASDAQVNRTLREIFAADSEDAEAGIKGIALPLTAEDGERYVAHVLPLTPAARRHAGMVRTTAAAVFVRKAALETPSSLEVIGRAYKLTPMELRVLLAIVEVGGIPEVATALGVADSTIKTHVGRLFEKTGAGRQADLVKLVAGFSTPLAG